jgi:hypothetical protein
MRRSRRGEGETMSSIDPVFLGFERKGVATRRNGSYMRTRGEGRERGGRFAKARAMLLCSWGDGSQHKRLLRSHMTRRSDELRQPHSRAFPNIACSPPGNLNIE